MSASVISICNRALLAVGARAQISSLAEGSTESDACSVLYSPTFESLGRSAHWNCLRQEGTLTLLKAAAGTPENPTGTSMPLPPVPWLYSYALPSDCLAMRYIVPSFPNSVGGGIPLTTASYTANTNIPGGGQIPYAVAYDTDVNNNPITVILTNQTQAIAVYTVNQSNPIIWDSSFQQAMVQSLAAFLVPALSLNFQLMQICIKTADAMIQQARVSDGNEGVTVVDHLPDWMRARTAGSSIYGNNGYAPFLYANYSNMGWPGY